MSDNNSKFVTGPKDVVIGKKIVVKPGYPTKNKPK